MFCPNCKKEIPDDTKFCPGCGTDVAAPAPAVKKTKKPVTKKWWFWVIIAVVLIAVIASVGGGDETSTSADEETTTLSQASADETTTAAETTTEITTVTTTVAPAVSEEEYKQSCESIRYKDIARQPENYEGRDLVFTGEVMQVQESSYSNDVVLLIHVTKDEYGYWDDLVYVSYTLPDGAPRILEDDIVKFYGECEGTYTYETVMGSSNTIPSVSAKYIDIQ